METSFIRQEHRLLHIIKNFLAYRSADKSDPKREAAMSALALRIALSFVPSPAVATTGIVALFGVYLAWHANQLAKESNQLYEQEITLAKEQVNLLKDQTAERLAVESLPMRDNYVHVWSAIRYKNKPPSVTQTATWYRFRVTNNSLIPISVVESFYNEAGRGRIRVDLPFFKSVTYENDKVALESPVELPIRLEPQESTELYALVPRRVTDPIGKYLMKLLRHEDGKLDTIVEHRLFTPNLLEDAEREARESFDNTKLGQLIHMQEIDFPFIRTERGLLYRKDDGSTGFHDANNDAPDGFIFRDGNDLHAQCNELMLGSTDVTYSDLVGEASTYEISFQSGSGAIYKTVLRTSDTPFGRLTQ